MGKELFSVMEYVPVCVGKSGEFLEGGWTASYSWVFVDG